MASSKVLEIIVKATDQASKSFDAISQNSQKLSDSLKDVKKYSWIATASLVWLWTVMVKQATDIEPVRKSFDQLAESIGENSTDMLKSLKEVSKGAVSEYDLMLASNKAMKLWVANNTDDMSKLMKIARLYGQQMWQDVTKSFDDIVTWLWRWSAMILDNLWIVVNQTEAQEKYAKSLWKTADELTDAEKKQALVNATLEEWQKALDKFGEPAQTMAERFAQLKNTFTDIWTRIWSALLPVIEKLLKVVQPIIDKIASWIEANPELASKNLLVATAVSWLIFVLSSLPWIVSSVTAWLSFLMSPIWLIIAWITALAIARATDFWWIREKTAEIVDRISEIIKPRLDKLKARRDERGGVVIEAVKWIRSLVEDIFASAFEVIGAWLEIFFQSIDVIMKIFSWDFAGAWEWIKNIWTTIRETTLNVVDNLFGGALDRIADKLVSFGDWFKNKRNTIKERVLWIATALWEWLKTWFDFRIAIFTWDWETASNIAQTVVQWLDQALTWIFWSMWENIKSKFQAWIDWVVWKMNAFKDTVMSIVNSIKDAWNSAKNFVWDVGSWISNAVSDAWDWASSPFRASWWPVTAGSSYVVGERWPEVFVPHSSWSIIPNEQVVNNNNWITINMSGVSIRKDSDIQQLAQEIVRMTKLEKNYWII